MKISDGPCVKQKRDRAKLIPSQSMEKQRGTNVHTMFGTLGEVGQGRNAMRVGRDQIKETKESAI